MTKLTNMIKAEIRATKQVINTTLLADSYAMDNTAQVRRLRRLAAKAKRDLKLDNKIIFVSSKDRKNFTDSKGLNGYYNSITKEIVVFVGHNSERKVAETLMHELTHAYQDAYMKNKYKKSVEELRAKKTTYKTCWHERHARANATRLINLYCPIVEEAYNANSYYAV